MCSLTWLQNHRRLSFPCKAHAPGTWRIRDDGRIRFVNATCGCRYFRIRIKKIPVTKISGLVWTVPLFIAGAVVVGGGWGGDSGRGREGRRSMQDTLICVPSFHGHNLMV